MKRSNETFMVLFYAPWCGHCKAFKPEYEKAAEKLKGIVDLVTVDCTTEQNKQLCGQYEVKGFPTVKLINHNGPKKAAMDYQYQRTAAAVVKFVLQHHRRPYTQLSSGSALEDQIVSASPCVIILTPSTTVSSAVYKVCRVLKDHKCYVKTGFSKDDAEYFQKMAFGTEINAETVNTIICKSPSQCKVTHNKNPKEIEEFLQRAFK